MLICSMKYFKYASDGWYFDNSLRITAAYLDCKLFIIKISAIKSNNSLKEYRKSLKLLKNVDY